MIAFWAYRLIISISHLPELCETGCGIISLLWDLLVKNGVPGEDQYIKEYDQVFLNYFIKKYGFQATSLQCDQPTYHPIFQGSNPLTPCYSRQPRRQLGFSYHCFLRSRWCRFHR